MSFKHALFLVLLIYQVSFTQKLDIETSFNQSGFLYSKPGSDGTIVCQFKKKEKCIIIDYLGRNHFKVQSSHGTGYVEGGALNFTKELDAHVDNYEIIRRQGIENAKKERDEILRKRIEEKELNKQKEADSMKQVYKLLGEKMKSRDSIKREQDRIFKASYKTDCHYLTNEIDKYDKVRVIETDYYEVNSAIGDFLRIKLTIRGNQKYIYFNFYEDVGCISPHKNNRSFVKVYLQNHDILTFFHSGDINCSNLSSLIGLLSENEVNRLSKSPIESIRIEGTKSYSDLSSVEYKEFFIDKLKCLNSNN